MTADSPPVASGGGEAPPEAWLLDDGAHLAHPLVAADVRIGRDPQSEVLVRDATVSRHHASVRHEAGRHVLHVTGSTGARVNGLRIGAAHVLEAGDRIEIGMRMFRYEIGALPSGVSLYAGHDTAALEPHDALRRTTETMAAVDPAVLAAATRRISEEDREQERRSGAERAETGGVSRVAIGVAVAVVLGTVALALAF